ncbi:MAG: hypothetical protein JO276_11120 [Sphingomonadaceae bacterium]|nr:hypothetical protein [Sphingomonadaceae bacterium]
MRLLAAITLALLPLTAAAATPVPSPARTNAPPAPARQANAVTAKCDRFGRMQEASVLHDPSPRAQRLGDLPPGDLHLTVEREVNGCHQPVVVRENIGGPAFGGR